ncbi:amino acid aminotransferase [Vagococcus sp. WN89Y]|uniref:amino acid aminotransferase n=1 Tax=Vagococcus sp. WN89Y TaxID=3457258 RepID=UPI003FCDF191
MLFEHLQPYPGDPILSLMDKFTSDPREEKVNLSVGFYYDENGKIPVLDSVREAKRRADARFTQTNGYLPMDGASDYCRAVQQHLFGMQNNPETIATIQTIGGSGALRIAADFLYSADYGGEVWISDPSWDNHQAIFARAGFTVKRYPWLNASADDIDFPALLQALQGAAAHSVVVVHACCHNPTGFDLQENQWDALFELCRERQLIPLLDAAYLGMGNGFAQDVRAVRKLVARGTTGLVTNSFSKVFSLYGERVGSLSVVCANRTIADNVRGQLKATVRANYSSPPRFGAVLVSEILNDEPLRQVWQEEVELMRERIVSMRQGLHTRLSELAPQHSHDYLLRQKGMFSFTGLSPEQVRMLREEYGVYIIGNGRLCVSGLNQHNLDIVARRIAAVL